MKGDAKRCNEAGFDGFLSKPVHREKLYRILERLLGKKPGYEEKDEAAEKKIMTQYSVQSPSKGGYCLRVLRSGFFAKRVYEFKVSIIHLT